jgi:hypothetical protein
MTAQQPSTSGTGPSTEEGSRKSDLSVAKVSAAALAAITAAVLGSTIGVAGTVIGAAMASVITTVSSTLYQSSLERSRERVRLLAARTMPLPRQRAQRDDPQPDVPQPDVPQPEVPQSPTAALEDVQPLAVPGPATARPRRTLRWTAMAAGSVAAFALAMTVITGFENAAGQTLSGGNTSTVRQVVGGEQWTPEPAPEAPAPETSAVPSETPEPTSSLEPTSSSGPEESDPSTGARPTGTRAPTDTRPTGTPTADERPPAVPLPTR